MFLTNFIHKDCGFAWLKKNPFDKTRAMSEQWRRKLANGPFVARKDRLYSRNLGETQSSGIHRELCAKCFDVLEDVGTQSMKTLVHL